MYKIENFKSDDEFIFRIYDDKDKGIHHLTNKEIGDLLNEQLHQQLDESAYRKKYQQFRNMFRSIGDYYMEKDVFKDLCDKEDTIYKEKVKLNGKLSAYRKELKKDAILEEIRDSFLNVKAPDIKIKETKDKNAIGEGILLISDWHIGAVTDNPVNTYDEYTENYRIELLLNKAIEYGKLNKLKKLHVINLGDMICGKIHVNNRILSNSDVIDQTVRATNYIYQLCINLSKHFDVDYSQCLDNHSRLNDKYNEHIESESLARLSGIWLKDKFKNTSVKYIDNQLDDSVGTITIDNNTYAFVHGHRDNPKTVLQDLSFMFNINFKGVFLGHWHNDKIKNFKGRKVWFNGSLMGVDDYAYNARYFSEPNQTMIIFNGNDTQTITINLQ